MKYLEVLKKVNPGTYAKAIAALTAAGLGAIAVTSTNPTPEQTGVIEKVVAPIQSQRDNKAEYWRTCCTSSNAMLLDHYRDLMPGKSSVVADDDYYDSVVKRGDTTDHSVHSRALLAWGLDTYWDGDGNYSKLLSYLVKGNVTVVNIAHKGVIDGRVYGGHCIKIVNYDPVKKEFLVNDPWGRLGNYSGQPNRLDGVYKISANEFQIRWQGGARYITKAQADKLGIERGI